MSISGKAQDLGKDSLKLSDSVVDYFAKMFSMAVSENKDEPNKLKASFQAIVPHAFGDHNAGINLTGYHPPPPPGTPGFCTKMCAQPQGFCTIENARGPGQ